MRMRPPHHGFTLTEVLIVVATILFIAAIIVPKLTSSQIAARESAALSSVNEIRLAEDRYSGTHPQSGFVPLAELGNSEDALGNHFIDQDLASGHKNGYLFTYVPEEKSGGAVRSFSLTAVPDHLGVSGRRSFFLDQSGVVHYSAGGTADASSPVIQ